MSDYHIDSNKLGTYLENNLAGFQTPFELEKFAGGQSNPTYKITADSGVYVLRRQPPGKLLKSAHAVDREFKVLSALEDSPVPVPKVFHLCEDPQVIGSMFYVMEYLDGNIYWNAALDEASSNAQRTEMYDLMNKTLVALHSIDVDAVGLTDYGRKEDYYQRQFSTWTRQYRASEIDKIDAMEQLMSWLEANLPEDDGTYSLVHGDFRLDNMMFNKNNSEIIAVLDWELSTVGHPYADLAYQCMQMRMGQGSGVMDGLAGIDRASLGIPTEKQYIDTYCQRMGIAAIENWSFYLAFSFFRLAAIAQGVAKRAQQGNASSARAQQAAAFVTPLAMLAMQVIQE
ncbi:MAG: phosphotransferase family protein [Gammaproteobacteria bacterium]